MGTDSAPGADPRPDVRRLSAWGRGWRVLTILAALGVLLAGQIADTNDWWPLGSLAQYASAHSLDGSVNSYTIDAIDTTGARVNVPLDGAGVGIERGDIESQLARIRDDPSLLQAVVDGHAALHPDEPAYVELILVRTTQQLHGGSPVGAPTRTDTLTWKVPS